MSWNRFIGDEMTSWYDIYKERMNQRYLDHVATKYGKFLEELYKIQVNKITEIGCGAGNITRLLRQMKPACQYDLVDNCPKMLGLAIENNPMPNCTFHCADVTVEGNIPSNSLVHSHGLLEHFEDEKIVQIVSNAMWRSWVQVHYVPSIEYITPSRGDERLMHPEQWEKIIKKVTRDFTISTFNDGHDIIIKI